MCRSSRAASTGGNTMPLPSRACSVRVRVSEQRLALVEGIIGIARTLHLDVIAEGIETEVQRDLLVAMGCQYGQGYLLAMPVAADQAETLVRLGHGPVPELPRVSP
ncbi:MAG TPA: EAL domain-containing protein [Streptosporangiaceae bacterium]